ncbi:LPXTG cell wall anchor domain-containing protein [Amycolatopsis sp. H20-H5]|uniref:LPXTG cell wall anchor domain-containing protein n=1 Tax=Amycolatopsis sp. H20-H5 TaxID=3046309 RepID=UPI002DB9EFDB|nr:LPXTG cell wall anchor domain-containing protein [Amycolatopsis sp. H20-H5]MEC3982775.1 LPXTG cell wall anchor domain-containing protein [Amycolatopsis sp. H20-H5]
MSRRSVRAALTVAAISAVTLLGTATGALACTTDDGRGHPIQGQVDKCEDVQQRGETLTPDNFTTELNGDKTRLKIVGLNEGVTVSAIVVNGGDDGHNLYYIGGKNELKLANLPWENLRAPFNFNGSQPKVGKWFACGTKTTKPTETQAPPTTTTKPTEGTPTKTAKPTPTTEAPTSSASPTTTSAPAVIPAGNNANGGGLASTGFDNSWLIWVGALLLLAGGGLLALLKFRRKA